MFGLGAPRTGWLVTDVDRDGDEVVVRMGHPAWPHPLFFRAPDEGAAVAWTMLRRSGVVAPAWRSRGLPPSLRANPPGSTLPSVRVECPPGHVLRMRPRPGRLDPGEVPRDR